jgi:hypothetical protein
MSDAWFGELLLWSAPAVGLVVHVTLARYNARRVHEDWRSFPDTIDKQRIGLLKTVVEGDAETLDIVVDSVREARAEGDADEAERQILLAEKLVFEATPDRLSRLRALGLAIRMAAAVTPLPPLTASAFRRLRLRGLAGLSFLVHQVLVSPAERFILRVHVLGAGFRMIRAAFARRRATVEARPAAALLAHRFEDDVSDFKTLDAEHLEAARACVVSLRLVPRDAAAMPQQAR